MNRPSSGRGTSTARSHFFSASTSSFSVPKLVSKLPLTFSSEPVVASQPSPAATPSSAPYSSVGTSRSPNPASARSPSRLLNAAADQYVRELYVVEPTTTSVGVAPGSSSRPPPPLTTG